MYDFIWFFLYVWQISSFNIPFGPSFNSHFFVNKNLLFCSDKFYSFWRVIFVSVQKYSTTQYFCICVEITKENCILQQAFFSLTLNTWWNAWSMNHLCGDTWIRDNISLLTLFQNYTTKESWYNKPFN